MLAETLHIELEELTKELADKHKSLGMEASGRWLKSLEIEIEETEYRIKGRILGEKYTEQLVFGRKPGRFPPIQAIIDWIEAKGIQSNIPAPNLGFLIARKIAERGTRYYQQGGTDLVDAVITDKRAEEIYAKLASHVIELMVEKITRDYKEYEKVS